MNTRSSVQHSVDWDPLIKIYLHVDEAAGKVNVQLLPRLHVSHSSLPQTLSIKASIQHKMSASGVEATSLDASSPRVQRVVGNLDETEEFTAELAPVLLALLQLEEMDSACS